MGANMALVNKYQLCLNNAIQRRDGCIVRLKQHQAWEKLEPHLPLQIPPRRYYRLTAFGLPISGTSTRHELPALHDEPTSHASSNQSSASTPSTVHPLGARVGGKRRRAYNAPRSGGSKKGNKRPLHPLHLPSSVTCAACLGMSASPALRMKPPEHAAMSVASSATS
jgi:hypothetical protein